MHGLQGSSVLGMVEEHQSQCGERAKGRVIQGEIRAQGVPSRGGGLALDLN